MRIGYGRIYPTDQDADSQNTALAAVGCDTVYTDDIRATGIGQPQLAEALEQLAADDMLTVTSLDRLAHRATDLVTHVRAIDERNAHLHILDRDLNTAQDPARTFFETIAALGQVNMVGRLERHWPTYMAIAFNQKRSGRPPLDPAIQRRVSALLGDVDEHGNRRHSISEIARQARVSRSTVYRYMEILDSLRQK